MIFEQHRKESLDVLLFRNRLESAALHFGQDLVYIDSLRDIFFDQIIVQSKAIDLPNEREYPSCSLYLVSILSVPRFDVWHVLHELDDVRFRDLLYPLLPDRRQDILLYPLHLSQEM